MEPADNNFQFLKTWSDIDLSASPLATTGLGSSEKIHRLNIFTLEYANEWARRPIGM